MLLASHGRFLWIKGTNGFTFCKFRFQKFDDHQFLLLFTFFYAITGISLSHRPLSAEMLILLADISSFVVDLLAFHFTEWSGPSSQNMGLTS